MPESITGSILAYMNTISDMQSRLETILTESRLNELFKPGRIKIRQEKLPYSVNIRLKLHNPYTFTAFELSQKKNGVKFSVYHLKTMPKELRLEMLALGGSQDNGKHDDGNDRQSRKQPHLLFGFLETGLIANDDERVAAPLALIGKNGRRQSRQGAREGRDRSQSRAHRDASATDAFCGGCG